MNSNEYISSGILENYVLGLTSESEAREIERMAALYPEIRDEITAIEHSLENFAQQNKVTPPPALKEKIWSAIQKEARNGNTTPVSDTITEKSTKKDAIVVPLRPSTSITKYAVAASVMLLIGSAAFNIVLYVKLAEVHRKLSLLESEKNSFAQQLQIQTASYHLAQNEIAFIAQPATKKIVLSGVPKFPDALAMVYYNSSSKEVFLKVRNLPTPPSDKQYQLWAIVAGKPVDAGVFDVTADLSKMKTTDNPQAFAVTLEKKGGSPTPSMEAMYVIGNI